ncbi:MAG: hypothetical protein GXO33_08250 [Epsilonproteobacteria bacterium]|nr:hypothetical protein [Campylobacterota bacterium]
MRFFAVLVVLLLTISADAAVRIMPLGDSITYDDTYADAENPRPASMRSGYRNYLWYFLTDAGLDIDFVGSQRAGDAIEPPFDPDNEGHPGWTSFDIADHAYEYMVQSRPDVVLLHIGTNDRTTTSPYGVELTLNEIDQYEVDYHTHVKVYVALIIDRRTPDGRIAIFNSRLKSMLEERIALGDDIVIVDMYHGAGLTESDYADNTHPNDHGYYKMARVWYNALMANGFGDPLHAFPTTLVPTEYIVSTHVDEAAGKVDFITEVPNEGIRF